MVIRSDKIFFVLDDLIGMAEDIASLNEKDYEEAIEAGIPAGEKIGRKFLLNSLKRSGIKRRSGDLRTAVAKSNLLFFPGGKGGMLRFYLGSDQGKDLYTYANALNYGRVNSSEFNQVTLKDVQRIKYAGTTVKPYRKVGAKRRKKLKNKVHGGSSGNLVKAANGLSYKGGTLSKTKAGSVVVETTLGTATVTKAFDFYKIKGSKEKRVLGEIFQVAREHLRAKIKKKMKRR